MRRRLHRFRIDPDYVDAATKIRHRTATDKKAPGGFPPGCFPSGQELRRRAAGKALADPNPR